MCISIPHAICLPMFFCSWGISWRKHSFGNLWNSVAGFPARKADEWENEMGRLLFYCLDMMDRLHNQWGASPVIHWWIVVKHGITWFVVITPIQCYILFQPPHFALDFYYLLYTIGFTSKNSYIYMNQLSQSISLDLSEVLVATHW